MSSQIVRLARFQHSLIRYMPHQRLTLDKMPLERSVINNATRKICNYSNATEKKYNDIVATFSLHTLFGFCPVYVTIFAPDPLFFSSPVPYNFSPHWPWHSLTCPWHLQSKHLSQVRCNQKPILLTQSLCSWRTTAPHRSRAHQRKFNPDLYMSAWVRRVQ